MNDLGSVRCLKEEDNKVIVKDVKIMKRWREYFCKLFNKYHEAFEFNNAKDADKIKYIRNIRD